MDNFLSFNAIYNINNINYINNASLNEDNIVGNEIESSNNIKKIKQPIE